MLKKEIWKDVLEYNGKYQVSNWGRVKSTNYRRSNSSKIMKPSPNDKGYMVVTLRKDNIMRRVRVHTIVGMIFVAGYKKGLEINHIDENRTNNNASNLSWVTHIENINYGSRTEKHRQVILNGKTSKKVKQMSLSGDIIKIWPSTSDTGRHNYNSSCVSKCCRGERIKHKGYLWEYVV